MLEIARYFERIAAGFSPVVLIVLGLVCVVVGLFVWLGGLGFREFLVAVVGAGFGGICGLFIIGRNVISVVILAAVACAVAVIFERTFITILAAVLAAVFGFAILVNPYIESSADFTTEIRQACLQMPVHNWAIIAALAVIFIVAGFFLWRFISALCCAVFGTLLVFAGMTLLLLYKGAEPISYISSRTQFFTAIFGAMIAFGTVEQLLLCQRKKKYLTRKRQANKDKQRPKETAQSWRSV